MMTSCRIALFCAVFLCPQVASADAHQTRVPAPHFEDAGGQANPMSATTTFPNWGWGLASAGTASPTEYAPTHTLTAAGPGGSVVGTTTIAANSAEGQLTQLRFGFRDARQRGVGSRPKTDIIFLIKREFAEHFVAPVSAAINDQSFYDVSV